jgi:hypothetical protein
MNKQIRILLLLVVVVLCGIAVFTPSSWHWTANNLQVKFSSRSTASPAYFDQSGFGWSKLGLFIGDWFRGQRSSTNNHLSQTQAWISGFSPLGVWITLKHSDEKLSFTKRFFVPSTGSFREDISSDTYITGNFE